MGPRLHGMARRAEQIELNRSSCAEMYARVRVPVRVHGAKTALTLAGGTEGSNPPPSSGESGANLILGVNPIDGRRRSRSRLPGFRAEVSQPPGTHAGESQGLSGAT